MQMTKSIGDIFRGRRAASAYGRSYGRAGTGRHVQPVDVERVARAQITATAFTCADLISKAIAQVRFECDDEHWDGALKTPNPFQSRYEFQYGLAWDALFFGNAYILRSPGNRGSTGMLSMLDATNVEPDGTLQRPRYRIRNDNSVLDGDRVIHVRHGGGNELEALGRVAGGWDRIEALSACDGEIHSVFRNGLSMSHVLHGGHADESAIKKMLQSIVKAFGIGGESRGGVVGLTGGYKLETIKGLTPADADLRNLRTDLIREIAALFGVPPFAVGGSSDTKFSNTVARHQQTNSQALLPLAENIAQKLEHAFGSPVRYNKVDLIRGDFGMLIELALQDAGGPVRTPNEARRIYLDEGPVEGGDKLRDRPAAIVVQGDRRGENDPDGSESDR